MGCFTRTPATWTFGKRVGVRPALDTQIRIAIEHFRAHLLVRRGFADATTPCWTIAVALRRMGCVASSIDRMTAYLLWMRDTGYSHSSQLNTALAFEAYADMRGIAVRFGRQPNPKRVLKDMLSEAEVARIIQVAPTVRLKAMMAVLAYSGVRSGEFIRLKVEDFDVGTNRVRILAGKNRKDRYAYVPAECTRLVVNYLRGTELRGGDPLFTTVVRGAPLAAWDLRKIVRVLSLKAGIRIRVYPHKFRHSLATILLNRGASVNLIREQLGHQFLETTVIYAQSLPARERTEYEMFKPAYV